MIFFLKLIVVAIFISAFRYGIRGALGFLEIGYSYFDSKEHADFTKKAFYHAAVAVPIMVIINYMNDS